MARVKDLWHSEVPDPEDPKKKIKRKTARHPDNGGSKDAKRWLAIWIGPDGKEKTKAFRIQDAAKKYARKMEEDVEQDNYIDPKAGRQLFGPLARKWLKLRTVGSSTRTRYEQVIRLHIEPAFAQRQIRSIKPSEVLEFLQDLSKTHGPSSQALAYMILNGVFELAVADKVRKDNPAKSPIIKKPQQEHKEEREIWSVERIWSVIDAHPDPYRAIPIVSAGCGLRQGEALGLALEDFDFEAGVLNLQRQCEQDGSQPVFKLPKGGKTRKIPLSPGVARAIQAHMEKYPPREYSLPWLREDGTFADEEHTCRLLFRWHGDHPNNHDRHIRTEVYGRSVWKPALVELGIIPPPTKGARGRLRHAADPEQGTHMFRRWFATALLDRGVSLSGVMAFCGHSKKGAPVTLRAYVQVTEETFEQARGVIDRTLFRLRAVQDQNPAGTVAELAAGE